MTFDRSSLYSEIEYSFKIEMPDDCISLIQIQTFGDLCNVVREQKNKMCSYDDILQVIRSIVAEGIDAEAAKQIGPQVDLDDILDPFDS